MRTINTTLVILFVGAAYAAAQVGPEPARPAVTFVPFADESPVGEELPPPPGAPFDVEAPMPWLADGIPGLLELALERAAAVNLISRTDLALSLKRRRDVDLSADAPFEVVADVARREGATYVVGGSFAKEKKDLSFTVEVWEVGAEAGAELEAEAARKREAELELLSAEIEKLGEELAIISASPALSPEEKEARAAEVNTKIAEVSTRIAGIATARVDAAVLEEIGRLAGELGIVMGDPALSWEEKETRATEIEAAMEELSARITGPGAPAGQSKEFTGKVEDVFSLADDAAKFVLEATGAAEEAIPIPRPPTADVEAFKWFAKGAASLYTGEQISFFLGATERDPGFAGAHLRLAHAYRAEKNYEDAKASYEKVRELADYYPSAPYGLALISRALEPQNADVAAVLLDEALAIDSSYAPVYETRGAVYFAAGDYEKAREAYEMFVAIWPTNKDGYYALGNALWLIGKDSPEWKSLLRSAVDYYEESLAIDPDFAACHYNLASVYKIFEDVEKASYHYAKYIELEPGSDKSKDIVETLEGWLPRFAADSPIRAEVEAAIEEWKMEYGKE